MVDVADDLIFTARCANIEALIKHNFVIDTPGVSIGHKMKKPPMRTESHRGLFRGDALLYAHLFKKVN
jgi:hypothetical protein